MNVGHRFFLGALAFCKVFVTMKHGQALKDLKAMTIAGETHSCCVQLLQGVRVWAGVRACVPA